MNHPSGTYYIAPAGDRQNEWAAGYDGNTFATAAEAESVIPLVVAEFGGTAHAHGLDWSLVTHVRILDITNYHD